MFLQVIQGTTSDAEGLKRQFERWQDEVKPGAKGYLGTTAGITDDGTVFVLARFTDEATARTNSDRPEQGAWWSETAKYFDGEPTFLDYTEVELMNDGGSDSAGFVQVMQGTVTDKARLRELEAKFMPQMMEMRPDILGGVTGYDGNAYTSVTYFTTEAEARVGEQKIPAEGSPEYAEMGEFMGLMGEITFTDLKDPILITA